MEGWAIPAGAVANAKRIFFVIACVGGNGQPESGGGHPLLVREATHIEVPVAKMPAPDGAV